jgi:L-lactate dehydrogenase complex protein LldE
MPKSPGELGSLKTCCHTVLADKREVAGLKVSLMVTCLGDTLFPQVGMATVRLLRRLGVEVDFPPAQTCCGQPFFNSGYKEHAQALARHTIQAFAGSSRVVTPSGSCAAMVKLEYAELFHDQPIWYSRARELAGRMHELSDFLIHVLGIEEVGARFPGKVTYHMACHLRGLGLQDEPERLLRHVKDLEFIPLERFDECCGFGGSFSVRYPGISAAMVQDKSTLIEKTGADAVVATDAGCLMNIGGHLRRRGSRVRALHLAEVLEKN